MSEFTNHFPDNIGQHSAVEYANSLIHLILNSPVPAPLKPGCMTGEAGMGKSSFVKNKFHPTLERVTGKSWKFVDIIPTESPTDFLSRYCSQVAIGEPTVIWTDEIHDLKHPRLLQWFKRFLETDDKVEMVKVRLGGAEFELAADPFNHIHLSASNEELTDEALVGPNGRYQEVYINPYNYSEIGKLLVMRGDLAGIEFSDSALEYLAKRVKGSGRAVKNLVRSALSECKQKIDIDAARRIVKRDGRYPDGLDQKDVDALKFLAKRTKASAGEVSATLREHEANTKNRLRILAGSLHCISTGRGVFSLSEEGAQYLSTLAKLQEEARKMKVAVQ